MQIDVSKTKFEAMMSLIDKAVAIIKQKDPTNREYNVARQLQQTKKGIIRKLERQNGKG